MSDDKKQSSSEAVSFDRIKSIYPHVDEEETALPRAWSSKDKHTHIKWIDSYRVEFKGQGNGHKDASSIRTTHPIPSSCGIYYFEIKIISKGREGYIGIGLTQKGVNLNRLPGWEKHSYGYHGDDGFSFASSGSGTPYGPTFTTNDVIGCCLNFIDNTCFFTKNGHNLGIAFTDLPTNLYPTVGLQTPNETIEANFGQQPFVFDFEDYRREWKAKIREKIERFPLSTKFPNWEAQLQHLVFSYLVHYGYCSTADAFAGSTGLSLKEELNSMRNRLKIQKLILAGRISESIELTNSLYPGLLENNFQLLFRLKCRQFVEMISGQDSEVRPFRSPRSSARSSPSMSPVHFSHLRSSGGSSPVVSGSHSAVASLQPISEETNGESRNGSSCQDKVEDEVMEEGRDHSENGSEDGDDTLNGDMHVNGSSSVDGDSSTIDVALTRKQLCGGNEMALQKLFSFGRELHGLSLQLQRDNELTDANRKLLQDAFSLLAYQDPWNSPVGYQLDPKQRESVSASLNAAILESQGSPGRTPLETIVSHTVDMMSLLKKSGNGSAAFVELSDYLNIS